MKNFINRVIIMLLGVCLAQASHAQEIRSEVTPQDWVISKNYYASYLLLKDPELSKQVFSDVQLKELLSKREQRYNQSKSCTDLNCLLNAFKWSDGEVEAIKLAFERLMVSNSALRQLVQDKLVPSNTYGLGGEENPKAYLLHAIGQDMKFQNYVIDVYSGGQKPNYPKIDSISFDVTNKGFLTLLKDVRQDVLKDCKEPYQYGFISMFAAVRLLEINERMDAAQLEPLMEGENKKALASIESVQFDQYPYSLLLVLGAGPNVYDQPISPGGMLRARMAARAYFDKQAPFIVLSGGRVHPYKTPYIEAIEMKKYLVENLLVPEEAIIIDPHARHTTTNLRNTARIMLKYGFPQEKYAMVTSSEAHIDFVEKMADRCIKELGYVPYELGRRINDVVLEFKPKLESMTIDADEPLDP